MIKYSCKLSESFTGLWFYLVGTVRLEEPARCSQLSTAYIAESMQG